MAAPGHWKSALVCCSNLNLSRQSALVICASAESKREFVDRLSFISDRYNINFHMYFWQYRIKKMCAVCAYIFYKMWQCPIDFDWRVVCFVWSKEKSFKLLCLRCCFAPHMFTYACLNIVFYGVRDKACECVKQEVVYVAQSISVAVWHFRRG